MEPWILISWNHFACGNIKTKKNFLINGFQELRYFNICHTPLNTPGLHLLPHSLLKGGWAHPEPLLFPITLTTLLTLVSGGVCMC